MNSGRLGVSEIAEVGSRVAVKNHYLGSWSEGFEVVELLDEGYRLRRVSDRSVLPDVIAFNEVRRADV